MSLSCAMRAFTFQPKILYIVALYPFIRSTFYIYAHRAWIFMLIYFMDAKTTQRMNNLIFKLCVCVCCYSVWNAHLFKHLVPFNTVHCQIDTNIRFRYASSYRNLLCISISILLFPPFRSSFVSVMLFTNRMNCHLKDIQCVYSHSLSSPTSSSSSSNGWNIQFKRYYFVAAVVLAYLIRWLP